MNRYPRKQNIGNRGIATLEMLIALTLIALSMSAVITLIFGSQSVSVGSQTNQEALYKAQLAIENARTVARTNFNDPSLNPGTTITTDTNGITYTKNLTVTKIDDFTKKITSLITWSNGSYTQLSTIVADWQSALGGDTCSATLSGDWTAPQVYGYVDFPSSAGATGVDAIGSRAYVVSDPSSSGTDDFYVIDVSDPMQKPLPTLGHFSTSYGLTDVHTVGGYSYVSAHSAVYQLLAIDVSNPGTLSTAKIKSKIDVTASSDTAYGNTLAYADKKIYLGLTNSSGPELHIFDVSTPGTPVELGTGYEVGATINHILVKNNIAYITTDGNDQVIALNVTSPSAPTLLGTFPSATLTGQSLALNGSTLYFGRIGGNGNPKLIALNSANITTAPQWTMNMSNQSGVYTMIFRSNLLFMTTADPNDGLQIWNVTNASATVPPVRYDTSPLNIQQTATAGTDCAGNLLYVAQKSNRAMQIVGPHLVTLFDYSLSIPPSDVILVRGGSSQNTSFTASKTSGTSQPVTFTNSALPSGVNVVYSNTTCSPTCSATLTLSASASAPIGTTPITISGDSPAHTTTFNLTVSAPPFNYSFTPTPSDISVKKGFSVQNTITVQMVNGAIPQAVTITPSGMPTGISVSPANASCTPSSGSCSVTFTFSATNAVNGQPNVTITVSGTSPAQTTSFKLKVNN